MQGAGSKFVLIQMRSAYNLSREKGRSDAAAPGTVVVVFAGGECVGTVLFCLDRGVLGTGLDGRRCKHGGGTGADHQRGPGLASGHGGVASWRRGPEH